MKRTESHTLITRDRNVPTDEELFQQYREGSESAFVTLFNRHKDALYTFCLRLQGDSDRAADAFQETYVRVVRFRDSFQPTNVYRAWLFTIARNTCRTLYRRERGGDSIDDMGDDIALSAPTEKLDFSEREMLAAALEKLPRLAREALLLYEYEGFSYEEIASMTDSGLSAVKVRIHRARAMLRTILGPWLNESKKT